MDNLRNRKIVFFTNDLVLGGAERQSLILARYLRKNFNSRVEFWGFLSTQNELLHILEEEDIPYRIFKDPLLSGIFKKIFLYIRLIFKIRHLKPDVILSFVYNSKINGGLVWRFTRVKLFVWNQRVEPSYYNKNDGVGELSGTFSEKLAVRFTKVFASNSDHSAELLSEYFKLPKESIIVIPNAIEIKDTFSQEEDRLRFGLDKNAFIVGMVANYTLYKDHRTAVLAWKIVLDKLKDNDNNIVLVFSGVPRNKYPGSPGNTFENTKALLYDLGISDKNALVLDYNKEVFNLINTFNVGLLCSVSEGCPNSLLECMACGLPVLGSDIPGIRFAVGEDNYMYLSKPGDPQDLADKILQFYYNEQLRVKTGNLNKQRVLKYFNMDRICMQYCDFISQNI